MSFTGINYGVDFVGGTEIQLQFQNVVNTSDIRKLIVDELGYDKASVQSFEGGKEILARLPAVEAKTDKETADLQAAMVTKITDGIKQKFADNAVEVRRIDSVGPQVGEELKRNALLATFYSLIVMLIYIGLRFDYKYAPGAVFCLFHDAVITLSIYVLLGKEVNVQTLAAILTLIGYSLNDTIVTFDRIRENERLYKDVDFYSVVNRSVNDTLSRSILTSLMTFMATAALWIFSDGVVQQIAFTLTIGIIIGSYSTIYIASPLVILMDKLQERRERSRLATAKA
jgi:preprotein translocase subunit SecF